MLFVFMNYNLFNNNNLECESDNTLQTYCAIINIMKAAKIVGNSVQGRKNIIILNNNSNKQQIRTTVS